MLKKVVQFISLFLTALIAGTVFGVWRGYNPVSFSGYAFVVQHQNAVMGLNVMIPALGAISILSTLVWIYLQRTDKSALFLLTAAAVLMIISAMVTRFGNQPINAVIMTWSPESPPDNWEELRDKWWSFHLIRTSSMLLALMTLLFSTVRSGPSNV